LILSQKPKTVVQWCTFSSFTHKGWDFNDVIKLFKYSALGVKCKQYFNNILMIIGKQRNKLTAAEIHETYKKGWIHCTVYSVQCTVYSVPSVELMSYLICFEISDWLSGLAGSDYSSYICDLWFTSWTTHQVSCCCVQKSLTVMLNDFNVKLNFTDFVIIMHVFILQPWHLLYIEIFSSHQLKL